MFEFIPVNNSELENRDAEELAALAEAIPRLLRLVPFLRKNPRLYYSRLECFLRGYHYGTKFQAGTGHLLELWKQGYLRDGELFFYGVTTDRRGSILHGVNSRTGEQVNVITHCAVTDTAAHRVWGNPSVRTVSAPVFPGERAPFPELMQVVYAASHKVNDKTLPDVVPDFRNKLELSENKPSLPEMEFVTIPSGEFPMGLAEEAGRFFDKSFPGVTVGVESFEIMSTPVTVGMWSSVTNQRPENIQGDRSAVDWVNWHECRAFAGILNSLDSEFNYRLPTEAEWEYSCRAGTATLYCTGNKPPVTPASVLQGCSIFGIRLNPPAGINPPNPWGLYDMGELVSEWCGTRCNSRVTGGIPRVVKGGAGSDGTLLPPAWSGCCLPWVHGYGEFGTGFRLVRTPSEITS